MGIYSYLVLGALILALCGAFVYTLRRRLWFRCGSCSGNCETCHKNSRKTDKNDKKE